MNRTEYFANYYEENKELKSAYYQGYNANRYNKLRRHNRYIRDKNKKKLIAELELLKNLKK